MLNAIKILDGVISFFKNIGKFFVEQVTDGTQPNDILLYAAVVIFIGYVVLTMVRTNLSYEKQLINSVDALNEWFYKNAKITEENLVEFNNLMKQVPKPFRLQWQLYMLNRDKTPSEYITTDYVIDRPMKVTTYHQSIIDGGKIFNVLIALIFVISLAGEAFSSSSDVFGVILYNASVVPFILFLGKTIFEIILNTKFSAIVADLYQNFHVLQKAFDKAVLTMPEYVDYEVLFTQSEIKEGIPILQEYLENREEKEKAELERAKRDAVEHEKYNFDDLGIDGSLLLERAIKESETYLHNRERIKLEIQNIQDEINNYKRNYDDIVKEQIRRQQVSRENIERLRKNQEESTNRIEAAAIKKQQETEMKKLEELQTEADNALAKYNEQSAILNEQIKQKEAEIQEKRKYVEDAMKSEFKSYSIRVYDALDKKAKEETQKEQDALVDENKKLDGQLQKLYSSLDDKDKLLNNVNDALSEKDEEIAQKSQEIESHIEAMQKFSSEIAQKSQSLIKKEDKKPTQPTNESLNQTNTPIQEKKEEQKVEEIPLTDEEKKQSEQSQQIVYDDNGGYYDSEGYYRYKNGTYYDLDGKFHDEFGGIYDTEGNYTDKNGVFTPKEKLNSEQSIATQSDNSATTSNTEIPNVQSLPTETPKVKATRKKKSATGTKKTTTRKPRTKKVVNDANVSNAPTSIIKDNQVPNNNANETVSPNNSNINGGDTNK